MVLEAGLPEEQGQGLEKGLEVVVVRYGRLLIQLNVSKHLRQAGERGRVYCMKPRNCEAVILCCQNKQLQCENSF